MAQSDALEFYLNGVIVVERHVTPSLTLAQYLRTQRRLVGTKLACGTGGCGSCTVMVSRWHKRSKRVVHAAVVACLVPLTAVHRAAVTTVEGIGSAATRLHPVQEALVQSHGVQCGFCSPGAVMSMYTLLRNNPKPEPHDVITALEGNLCRCTGYMGILEGFTGFCKLGENCMCMERSGNGDKEDTVPEILYDSTQEPIFPPDLQLSTEHENGSAWRGQGELWLRPRSLRHLLELMHTHQGARLVAGHTAFGFTPGAREHTVIHVSHLDELCDVTRTDDGLLVGAGVTISALLEQLVSRNLTGPEDSGFKALEAALSIIGSKQIRNMATVGGHVAVWPSNSDLTPLLVALGANAVVACKDEERKVHLTTAVGGGLNLTNTEVITGILLPRTSQRRHVATMRQSRRKAVDMATVSMALVVDVTMNTAKSLVVKDVQCVMAGFGKNLLRLTFKSTAICGKPWDEASITTAMGILEDEIKALIGQTVDTEDRRHLALGLFFRGAHQISCSIQEKAVSDDVAHLPPGLPRGCRTSEAVGADQAAEDAVGRPVPHRAARQATSGEAVFLDDMSPYQDELHAAFVLSARPHARLLGVETAAALALPGVAGVLSAPNVPGSNTGHGPEGDETLFADTEVTCVGHVVAAVFADSHELATRAAKLVEVQYEDMQPIITIQDAIEHNSFYHNLKHTSGDVSLGFEESQHVVEGEFEVGGQEHFYMEPHCARAVVQRGEGEVHVDSATQVLHNMQGAVGRTLGFPRHKVVCRTKRLGGGFGGKNTRAWNIAATAALGAYTYDRPTRMVLSRADDMLVTGGRHPTLTKYKIGISSEGLVKALEMDVYFNAGNSLDESIIVSEWALLSHDNGYRFENTSIHVHTCRTNRPSNTAFRGFGVPQMLAATEMCMTRVAEAVGLPQTLVREKHIFAPGEMMPFNMRASPDFPLRRCWDQLLVDSNYAQRRLAATEYNSCHTYKKKGFAVMPIKYGIRELIAHNKAAALVHIYTDGTVLITHGGVEMGQGLHTKVIQIASRVLSVSVDIIHISDTATDKIANADSTSASTGTDQWGAAAKEACEKLMNRLASLRTDNPELSWQPLIRKAYKDKINLSAMGYFYDTDEPYDFETGRGLASLYQVYGAVCSEVVLDCLTGDHTVLQVDIVMDVGHSLNPAVDIGQLEGAFLQGYGLFTLEQLVYDVTGRLVTVGPGDYKVPTVADTPRRLSVSLLKDSHNPHAIYSSKGISEPSLCGAVTVWLALRDAVKAARGRAPLRYDSPATAGRLRQALAAPAGK